MRAHGPMAALGWQYGMGPPMGIGCSLELLAVTSQPLRPPYAAISEICAPGSLAQSKLVSRRLSRAFGTDLASSCCCDRLYQAYACFRLQPAPDLLHTLTSGSANLGARFAIRRIQRANSTTACFIESNPTISC
jgi:hypothetical protein